MMRTKYYKAPTHHHTMPEHVPDFDADKLLLIALLHTYTLLVSLLLLLLLLNEPSNPCLALPTPCNTMRAINAE